MICIRITVVGNKRAGYRLINGGITKIITGNTVTISPNIVVTIGGPTPANVYTNNPNYTGFGGNNSSTGTFAGAGAITKPRAAAPGY